MYVHVYRNFWIGRERKKEENSFLNVNPKTEPFLYMAAILLKEKMPFFLLDTKKKRKREMRNFLTFSLFLRVEKIPIFLLFLSSGRKTLFFQHVLKKKQFWVSSFLLVKVSVSVGPSSSGKEGVYFCRVLLVSNFSNASQPAWRNK